MAPIEELRARYAHTNLIARDCERLARFYVDVFGCEPVGPERDQSGTWLEQATGVRNPHLRGRHLRLPGHGAQGPTLEIYSYDDMLETRLPVANQTGYGHLAFEVSDVRAALRSVLDHGGSELGSIAESTISGVGEIEVTYARDPEGNILELQAWRAAP